jgi:superfamily I DNA and/or RNA helicase
VPDALRPFSYLSDATSNLYDIPLAGEFEAYSVVVATCGTSGAIWTAFSQLPSTLFDLVIIDEASQATEAEALVPLQLCKPTGLVVLAGDPQQLAATMRTGAYKMCSVAGSLQERLLTRPAYAGISPANGTIASGADSADAGNSRPGKTRSSPNGVFLAKNYRSHECILHVPSQLFYGGALESCGAPSHINSMLRWAPLPKDHSFPILFIGVDGMHMHDVDSPSFYNINELSKVVDTCRQLISDSSLDLKQSDIGVIAAFRAQVLKLRLSLRAADLRDINVGGIEDYQGQEFKVIIITTVLTSPMRQFAQDGAIGLTGNPKKFNVAVTRGMALCVVIGQPYYLHDDPCWRAYMEYCDLHGAYTGYPCNLLRRHRQEELDEEALLNAVAQTSILGAGYEEIQNPTKLSQYFFDDSAWRVLL